MKSFLEWIVRPTWLAVIVMTLTTSAVYLAAASVSETTLRRIAPAPGDDPHVTSRARDLVTERPDRGRTRVALIGGSTATLSLWSERALEQDVREAGGGETDVFDLTSSLQPLAESLALTEWAACHGAKVVVFAANVHRLTATSPDDRSARMRLAFFAARDWVLIGWDRIRALSPTSTAGGRRQRRQYLRQNIAESESIRATRLADLDRAEQRMADAPLHLDYSVLERSLRAANSCGASLVFLATPAHPALLDSHRYPAFSAAFETNNRRLASMTADSKTPIVLNRLVEFQDTDFLDWGHLKDERAIRQSTEALARSLSPLIREIRR